MISGLEISRLVGEFEQSDVKEQDTRHHKQYPAVQLAFKRSVKNMCTALRDMGHPFRDESDQLVTIDTKDIMDASVVETLRKVATMGKQQYQTFVEERLHPNSSKCLCDKIPKNKIRLFGTYPTKKLNKHKEQVFNLKADNQLFSRMYISCQVRQGNLAEFFRHECESTSG